MPHLVEVSFKGNRKEFFLCDFEEIPSLRVPVVVEADRGEDLGHVHATGELAEKRAKGVPHGPGEEPVSQSLRRLATPDDLQRLAELRDQDESARRRAMERVRANSLQMKLTDAEWRWDRKKLTIYFTADKRVDFRNLVRELASTFRTRIELKQIGVRDEARRLNGIGRCGREYCSASWLPELRPVNLGVAKDQRLSLNPSQISGACGRLMCCLRYEHEFYVQQRKRFPKEGKVIFTSKGEERVIANDIFRERVTLRAVDGESRTIPLTDLRQEMISGVSVSTGERSLHDEETPSIQMEALTDEVIRLQDTSELPAYIPGGRPPRRRLPVVIEVESVPEESHSALPASDAEENVEGDDVDGAGGDDAGEDAAEGTGDDAAAQGVGRGRRRRGRRGGRGGRRGGHGPSSEPGGAPAT